MSILVLFLCANISFGQQKIDFQFDYAKFKYDSTSNYIEFYYELGQKNLTKVKSENGFQVEAIIHIEMQNVESNEYFLNRDWKIQNVLQDTSGENAGKNLSGVIGFVVNEGKYNLMVQAKDSYNSEKETRFEEVVNVNHFSEDKFQISDIQLANRIITQSNNENSIFYKNTLEVFPNPARLYSMNSPVMFYYSELYNLDKNKDVEAFKLQKILTRSNGIIVYSKSKYVQSEQNSVVEIGLVSLSNYPSDTYKFSLTLIDTATNQAYVTSKRFYLYNPDVEDTMQTKASTLGYLGSEFGVYSEDDCDETFEQLKYIVSSREKEMYQDLKSLDAKREFLYKFWLARDPDPSTLQNEYKKEYMERVKYANENFGTNLRIGYKTDMGRVYIMYGKPDQRDYYRNQANLKPYEVWFYNSIEGGVEFVFGDITGFSNYRLLNSTKRGEVQDPNWKQRLSTY
jgi:GWxTD domain-containing protein